MLNKLIKFFIALTLTLTLIAFAACEQPAPTELSETWEDQYTEVLLDANLAPEQIVIDSRQYDLAVVYNDSTLTDEEKAALMMKQATLNETLAYRYAYFNNTQGTTTLSDNSGTLIYQRTRRQNLNAKYDVTLKLPVNHNFNSLAQTFVTSSTIRLVTGGKYYRMEGDNATLGENGILASSGWKKKSGKFNIDEDMV
jgi:lipopolysaccharide export LptBFGC system permease protein LptF